MVWVLGFGFRSKSSLLGLGVSFGFVRLSGSSVGS